MDTIKLKNLIIDLLDEKNGGEIKEIEIKEKSTIADYFIIATGKNAIHVRTLAEFLMEKLEEKDIPAIRNEGVRDGRWAVVDYGNIIVHVFNAESRGYYCLEKLWS